MEFIIIQLIISWFHIHFYEEISYYIDNNVLVGIQRTLRIAPRGVVDDLVLDDEAEGCDGARLVREGLEDPGRWLEIKRLDLEEGLGIRGGEEWWGRSGAWGGG